MIESVLDFRQFENVTEEKQLQGISEQVILSYVAKHTTALNTTLIPSFSSTDCIVLCVVRNGKSYLTEFLHHYRSLGIKHFVFFDNGSTDDSLGLLADQPDVTLLQCLLPYKIYFQVFKRFLIKSFGHNVWSLVVDIDEFFSYPYSSDLSFSDFLEYQNLYKYNAVVTQMLDLFPKGKISSKVDKDFRLDHKWYDISELDKQEYSPYVNIVSNPDITFFSGGVRKAKFDMSHDLALTKHALVKYDYTIKLLNDHSIENARVSDSTACLLHYKYVGDFESYVKKAIKEKNHYNESQEYKKYYDKIKSNKGFSLSSDNAEQLDSTDQLITNGFLIVSDNYKNYISHGDATTGEPSAHLQISTSASATDPLNRLERIEELNKENQRLLQELDYTKKTFKSEMKAVRSSYSWKIGQFFVTPVFYLLRLFRKR